MKKGAEIKDTVGNRDRIHVVMTFLSLAFLALSAAILIWIVRIQNGFHVKEKYMDLFTPAPVLHTEIPERGRILATDGRPLAISAPQYDIFMDCTVRKQEFRGIDERERSRLKKLASEGKPVPEAKKAGEAAERLWQKKADSLSWTLAALFPEKTAAQYYDEIIQGRFRKNKAGKEIGNGHLTIHKNVNLDVLNLLKKAPLFREGKYRGGIVVEPHEERIYPYDSLARRVIGYIKDTLRIGLEANFDYELHGTAGHEWRRMTDGDRQYIRELDSTLVKAKDGNDIRTTLNVDFQDIADKALRRQIADDDGIRAGIAIIMEVETGAIRAMVNLSRGKTPETTVWERENLALRQVGEQGSVMKTVTLLSLVEDGYVRSLEQTIPTNNGFVPNYRQDVHILDYQRETGRREISVKHGFEISSNYVFTYLAEKYYGEHPQAMFDHIYAYRLGEAFDFDIDGLATPVVNRPGTPGWSKTTLGTTAYGYGMSVTPLHVATFYNGIAGKGRMMKPYLVESVEKDGVVLKRYKPAVLNNICSRATADTVTRALAAVVNDGTAARLKAAKLPVAGKTGTAQVVLSPEERGGSQDPYHDMGGRKKNQGTFVGFFPADQPKYTILVTVYSYLSRESFYGGTKPALAVREIVDQIYAIDGTWDSRVAFIGHVPAMACTAESEAGRVPNLKGLGLKDALYLAEAAGMRCSYSGAGHVAAQSPEAGSKRKEGETLTLTLK